MWTLSSYGRNIGIQDGRHIIRQELEEFILIVIISYDIFQFPGSLAWIDTRLRVPLPLFAPV